MANFNLEEWRRNRPPQPGEMSDERVAMYRAQRANKPVLNQAGTFMHGGGTFDEWDYNIEDEVDFDAIVDKDMLRQAMQGRFGDSMMRKVGGEQAHVNPREANMIDNYGPAGEAAVMQSGAGTRNPSTGKKEYFNTAMQFGNNNPMANAESMVNEQAALQSGGWKEKMAKFGQSYSEDLAESGKGASREDIIGGQFEALENTPRTSIDSGASNVNMGPIGQAMGAMNTFGQAGRFGDTQMRHVAGVPSHVNSSEAAMIDRYGPQGERMAMEQGAGTINPATGYPEYFPVALAIAAGVGAIGAGLAAHKKKKAIKKAKKQQKKQMADIKEFDQMGEEFMDPTSQRNQMFLQNIQQQGMNQVALQSQLAGRNAAAHGGGLSGVSQQQTQQAGLQAGLQGRQQWMGMMGQQQQAGLGIMGQALQMKGGIRDTMSELDIAKGQAQAAGIQGVTTGLQQGLAPTV